MSNYFPPDVAVRIDGDLVAGRTAFGPARALLFSALNMEGADEGRPIQLSRRIDDDTFVSVLLIGGQKIVNIQTTVPPREIPVPPTVVPEPVAEDAQARGLYMLTGIARGPSTVTDGDGHALLHDFRPTAATATAYALPNAYADNRKLGEGVSTIQQVKGSMFSGAMKRVVQAVFGLGRINDTSGYYLTPPSAATRHVPMAYSPTANQTHGIYKAATGNHWLVEISASRGVLAMPLPLIRSTKGPSYRAHLAEIGDVGGLAVCNEFGGLPSGETFPTGTALTNAITAGKVLRLLTATDLEPYYAAIPGETHTIPFSWAFSASGRRAGNTRFVYKKITGDPKLSLSGEHWSLSISLSLYNLSPGVGNPVGSGSASLSLLSTGRINKDAMRNFWAGGASENIGAPLMNFASLDIMDLAPRLATLGEYHEGWGAVLYCFYRGEYLETVKFVPPYCFEKWDGKRWYENTGYTGPDMGLGPNYYGQTTVGDSGSPGGLISASVDLRIPWVSQRDWGTPVYTTWSSGIYNNVGQLDTPDQTYYRGVGAFTASRYNCIPVLLAIVPGYTREAVIAARFTYELGANESQPHIPATMKAYGIFSDLGAMAIECDQGFIQPPTYSQPWYFGASINAGPNAAYTMTSGIFRQPTLAGLPAGSPGYKSFNLLPDTGAITVARTNFIGGY